MARMLRRLTVVAGAASAAKNYVRKHPDQVNRWAEKAGRFIDSRTKGKYHNKIKGAVEKVHTATDKAARS